jgi:hypothetical protein
VGHRKDVSGGIYVYGRLTPKREKFIKLIAVDNLDQKDAYIAAFGRKPETPDKTIIEKASKLAKKLKDNIAALRQLNSEFIKYDAEACYLELEDLRQRNLDSRNNQSVVARTIELKMRLVGLGVEHHDVTANVSGSLTLFADNLRQKEAVCQ